MTPRRRSRCRTRMVAGDFCCRSGSGFLPAPISRRFCAGVALALALARTMDRMTSAIQNLPAPHEVAERIRACRAELAALKRLFRAAKAAEDADAARRARKDISW